MSEVSYRTISKTTTGFYREKGSKFTAYAIPCSTEEQAKEHISELWKRNPSACHVCFAWRFGTDQKTERYSDDGEPNNSAGKPIFGQIEAFDLTNVLIAVVRIYGGTNLGVGGLIQAYKTCSKEALDAADIETRSISNYYNVAFDAGDTGTIMHSLNQAKAEILEHGFEGQQTLITFRLPLAQLEYSLGVLEENHLIELNFIKTE